MRIALAVEGSRGDVHPMLGLGDRFEARGHEVVVCAPPDVRAEVEARGMEFRPVGLDVHEGLSHNANALLAGGAQRGARGLRLVPIHGARAADAASGADPRRRSDHRRGDPDRRPERGRAARRPLPLRGLLSGPAALRRAPADGGCDADVAALAEFPGVEALRPQQRSRVEAPAQSAPRAARARAGGRHEPSTWSGSGPSSPSTGSSPAFPRTAPSRWSRSTACTRWRASRCLRSSRPSSRKARRRSTSASAACPTRHPLGRPNSCSRRLAASAAGR